MIAHRWRASAWIADQSRPSTIEANASAVRAMVSPLAMVRVHSVARRALPSSGVLGMVREPGAKLQQQVLLQLGREVAGANCSQSAEQD